MGKGEIIIQIEGLYEISTGRSRDRENEKGQKKSSDVEKLMDVFLDAFGTYPKLEGIFPQKETRMAALEASIRFYTAYDLRYGKGYALDEEIKEGVVLVESGNMRYNFFKHFLAGSYSSAYRAAMKKLSREERKQRRALFAELDRLELTLDLPEPHLYVDFLGVLEVCQRQGRGRNLMEKICQYAQKNQIPIMLFTNTDADVAFYKSLGFVIVGVTKSERFQFTNTYLVKYPEIIKLDRESIKK